VIDEFFAFIAHLIDGLYDLGQKFFQTNRSDKLIG
jgi:hypothetical protein